MARSSDGPWFRKAKKCWYSYHDGRQVSLGVKGERNGSEAIRAWYRLMAGFVSQAPEEAPRAKAKPRKPTGASVQAVVDGFLADCRGRMTANCLKNYGLFLRHFAGQFGRRKAETVTAREAEAFSLKPEWSSTYRAGFLGCLSTAFRWAVRSGMLPDNPFAEVRKPPRASRGADAVITPDEHARLIAHADPLMRDYLTILWGTGARPGEVAGLTAEQVRAAQDGDIPLTRHKSAHKGRARFLILTGDARETAERRAGEVGGGLMFPDLNPRKISRRVARLCRVAGVRPVIAYGYRHTYTTQALSRGVPNATVAALLGHSGTQMLHRHYSHLTSQAQVLREAAARVR